VNNTKKELIKFGRELEVDTYQVVLEFRFFVNMVVNLRVHTKARNFFIPSEIINFAKNTAEKARKKGET
jgi:hypothetical protein